MSQPWSVIDAAIVLRSDAALLIAQTVGCGLWSTSTLAAGPLWRAVCNCSLEGTILKSEVRCEALSPHTAVTTLRNVVWEA